MRAHTATSGGYVARLDIIESNIHIHVLTDRKNN